MPPHEATERAEATATEAAEWTATAIKATSDAHMTEIQTAGATQTEVANLPPAEQTAFALTETATHSIDPLATMSVTPDPATRCTHTVEVGDTLFQLAQTYSTTVEKFRTINPLTADALFVGSELIVPDCYKPGDSLTLIAETLGTTVEGLRLLNRLTDELLSVRQEFDVPGCAPDDIDPDSPENPYFCDDVPIGIVIKTGDRDVRCEVVEISEIDKHPLMNAGIKLAVDVWGRAEAGVGVCFQGDGSLVFMDTSVSPPAVSRLSLIASGDMMFGKFSKSGVVVHVSALSDDS